MEFYFLAAGQPQHMALFENRLNTIPVFWPIERDGVKYQQPSYSMLQEMKLFRLIFPKEYKDNFLKTLDFDKSSQNYAGFNKKAVALRLMLNAKKFEKADDKATPFLLYKDKIAMIPIGYKEDVISTLEGDFNGNIQEAL